MTRPNPVLVTSGPLPYLLSLPSHHQANESDPETESPVLCFLHGFDEGHPAPIEQALTRHGPLRGASSSVATSEFIVVAPQMPVSGDFWHRYADAVAELIQNVQYQHRGDGNRTFLTGFSFGGNGVFDLGLVQPGLWRALWPVDPTRVPHKAPEQPVWLSSGQVSRFSEERFISRLQLERLQPDDVEMQTPGDRVYLDQMQNHVGTAAMAYQDDRIYRWLLSR